MRKSEGVYSSLRMLPYGREGEAFAVLRRERFYFSLRNFAWRFYFSSAVGKDCDQMWVGLLRPAGGLAVGRED